LVLDLNEFININSKGNGLMLLYTHSIGYHRWHVNAKPLLVQLRKSTKKCETRMRLSQNA